MPKVQANLSAIMLEMAVLLVLLSTAMGLPETPCCMAMRIIQEIHFINSRRGSSRDNSHNNSLRDKTTVKLGAEVSPATTVVAEVAAERRTTVHNRA